MNDIENDLGEDVNGVTVHEKLDELIDNVNSGGSIEDREVLANAITSKGIQTNVYDTLSVMAENVSLIQSYKIVTGSITGSYGSGDHTHTFYFGQTFNTIPIKVGVNTSSYGFYIQNIGNISKTGFTAVVRMNTTGTRDYNISWFAIVKI